MGSIYMGHQFLDGLTVEDGADILSPDSKTNCRSKLRKISKGRKSHFYSRGTLKSRNPCGIYGGQSVNVADVNVADVCLDIASVYPFQSSFL
jgi:hypothetical protein